MTIPARTSGIPSFTELTAVATDLVDKYLKEHPPNDEASIQADHLRVLWDIQKQQRLIAERINRVLREREIRF